MQENVRHWFERRGSRVDDWPVETLLAAKGRTRVSVVLPALNEEDTVGDIVAAIRGRLVDEHPLVDELVVMDSGSTDRTAELAAKAGARVVAREEVLPEFAPLPGKGEVLWRSLAATTGDVIAFVDSDLIGFDADYVTGLLGPLLTEPETHFVKATYDRPLGAGAARSEHGGGRVTELVARPLINLYWPELAGFVQPLGGEYAARRWLLERLPFPTGYGVELGILVDALREVGLAGLAQVDLVKREHRNHPNAKLGAMASEIMQTAMTRLAREGRAVLPAVTSGGLTQFERHEAGYRVHTADVTPYERPPFSSTRAAVA